METVKDKVEQLENSIEQIILDFRKDTGIMPHITVMEKRTGPCASVHRVIISVPEELLPLLIK